MKISKSAWAKAKAVVDESIFHELAAGLVARAIMVERERCLDICAAEREWGDFHPDDVVSRIENGEGARQIQGWNCPSEN